MHELAVCQSLLRQVERLSREHGSAPARRILVRCGPLSGIVPDLLQRAFGIARAGSAADRATLAIELTPVRVECRDCEAQAEVPTNKLVCPTCGSWRTRLVAGDELLLQRVEFDATPSSAAA